jgi:hypothetical protein
VEEKHKKSEAEEEDLSDYWMISWEREVTVNCKRKMYIALCRKLALREAMDVS